jgi:hypothetical protein
MFENNIHICLALFISIRMCRVKSSTMKVLYFINFNLSLPLAVLGVSGSSTLDSAAFEDAVQQDGIISYPVVTVGNNEIQTTTTTSISRRQASASTTNKNGTAYLVARKNYFALFGNDAKIFSLHRLQ